jgi:tripartite ATP-independent transporter DctP family solute receptor
MTQFNRRKFLIATGAAAIASPWVHTARAAEFEYKFGTNLPATHPLSARLIEATKAIKEQTDGKLNIRVFPNNQLGGDPAMFAQLRSGALEFFAVSGANALSSLVPKAAISGVGFAFKNYDQVWQALDGELGKHIRAQITGAGLVVMDKIWDNGFRQITNNVKPIATIADLSGMKIRVPIGKLWISLFESLGAAPSGISFNEVYSALQTHVVDGQENPLAIASVARLYEVQKYCSLTNHMWDGFWVLSNKNAWNKIPLRLQEIAAKNFNEFAVLQRKDIADMNAQLRKSLEEKGMSFNTADPASFRDKLRGSNYYANWRKEFGDDAWALLEKFSGKLA